MTPPFRAGVRWVRRPDDDVLAGRYGRGHDVIFDGATTIAATASAHVVGKWAAPHAIDPEQMLVAALSSCHMLSFLHTARLAGFAVAAYEDDAEGVMERIGDNRHAVTHVTLRPSVTWTGEAPDHDRAAQLHHDAHDACFIANSVRTVVSIRPRG